MILDSMSGSEIFSAIDLMDGFYQILMREQDVPLTAVSTPSGMLWESFAPSYFDDVFVHSKAEDGRSAEAVHLDHLRRVFDAMRNNKLSANLKNLAGTTSSPTHYLGDQTSIPELWMVPKRVLPVRIEAAAVFLDSVFRLHGLPETLVSDRDPRFTSAFWRSLFRLLDTRLQMSTAAHPETDGQTERMNRVLEDILRSYATSFQSWSEFLPLVEFAINNAVHASTGLTPFYVNYGRHPHSNDNNDTIANPAAPAQDGASETSDPALPGEVPIDIELPFDTDIEACPSEENSITSDDGMEALLAMKYALIKFRVYLLGKQQFAIYTDHASRRPVTTPRADLLAERFLRLLERLEASSQSTHPASRRIELGLHLDLLLPNLASLPFDIGDQERLDPVQTRVKLGKDRLLVRSPHRLLLVPWLGYPDDQDTWEHGPTLALEIPGLVRLYEEELREAPRLA
ncbi:hypothetical protein ATCC90586_010562 [Pythium insidiosum]|nr:hypothetical protein ATCC90586_010562 [Pythium insidiosum]